MNWLRILGYAALIIAATNVIAFISGFTMGNWEFYGPTYDIAKENSRLIRRIFIGIVVASLYWKFCNGVSQNKFLHVVVLFIAIQLIDIGFTMVVFGETLQETFEPWVPVRGSIAAIIGYCISLFSVQRVNSQRQSQSSEL